MVDYHLVRLLVDCTSVLVVVVYLLGEHQGEQPSRRDHRHNDVLLGFGEDLDM